MSGLEGLHDGDNRGGLGLVPFPAPDSQRKTTAVDQQADDDLGIDPPVLGVTHPPQVVLLLGLEIERGDVVQAQGQTGGVGDVLEQGLRDRLTVAPLLSTGQGAEQGPHGNGLQAQVTQHPGDLGLGGRLDQTRQNHLLKGPITPDRLTQPQTPVGAVQDLPQQPGVLGLHHGSSQAGASRCRLQGLQVQQPLALPGGDLLPPSLQQGRHLGLVVG